MRHGFRTAALFAAVSLASCGGHGGGAGGLLPQTSLGPAAQSQGQAKAFTPFASSGYGISITPNFKKNFGMYNWDGAQVGHGPGAHLRGGIVDFGNVQAGIDYIYRYAAEVNVTSSTSAHVYAEASTSLAGPSSTLPTSTLSWEPTHDPIYYIYYNPPTCTQNFCIQQGVNEDPNVASDPGVPFQTVSAPGTGQTDPIAAVNPGKTTLDYDYLLRLPANAQLGAYNITIVYTVAP